MATNDKRPVMDTGEPYRKRPYTAGGQQGELSSRKTALLATGTIGYVPGHDEEGRGSSATAGYVHEAPPKSGPVPGDDDGLEYAGTRRPMPREQPVHSYPSHTGTIVRYLDGHSEIHRERPGLVELLGNPHVHPGDKEDIRAEIAHRDAVNNHKYW